MAEKLALYRWRGVTWQFEDGKAPAGAVRVADARPTTPEQRAQPKKAPARMRAVKKETE